MNKIPVVDDSETLRMELKATIEGKGHTVIEAENGAAGIDALRKNQDIQLIVCDVNMPIMNGLTMCQKVSEDATLKKVPIVMLTTESNLETKLQAKAYGVKAWITKPASPDKVIDVISKLLGV